MSNDTNMKKSTRKRKLSARFDEDKPEPEMVHSPAIPATGDTPSTETPGTSGTNAEPVACGSSQPGTFVRDSSTYDDLKHYGKIDSVSVLDVQREMQCFHTIQDPDRSSLELPEPCYHESFYKGNDGIHFVSEMKVRKGSYGEVDLCIGTETHKKFLKKRRRNEEIDLEQKIRQQMQIYKKEPAIAEEFPDEEIEEKEEEELKEEQLPELTNEMNNKIDQCPRRGYPGEVLVDKFLLKITKNDIATLDGLNWLNDEIINFYMNMLMERGESDGKAKVYAFNTFFYPKMMSGGQAAVKRWTRRVDVLAVDYILIPVHLGMHWCLAVINFKKKDIQYYDSMSGNNTQCLNALKKYLCDESQDKRKKEFDLSGWKATIIKDIPQQMNGSDCGMFACKYAEYITREAPITFTQANMPYFRRRMVYEIVTAKLLQ